MNKHLTFFVLSAAIALAASKLNQNSKAETRAKVSSPSSTLKAAPRSSQTAAQQVIVKVQAATSVVLPGQKVLLAARINGAPDLAIEWSLKEGDAAGSITPSGDHPDINHGGPQWVYTAPNAPGTYHVITTAIADPAHPV